MCEVAGLLCDQEESDRKGLKVQGCTAAKSGLTVQTWDLGAAGKPGVGRSPRDRRGLADKPRALGDGSACFELWGLGMAASSPFCVGSRGSFCVGENYS